MRRDMAAGPDWDHILEAARRHRVASLLLPGLQACQSPNLPARVVAALRQQALAGTARSLAHMRAVARLSRLFAQAGIRMLALKGVILSAQLYQDPALRDPRDVDLLVDPEDFPKAEMLLVEAGYHRSGPELSPRQASAYRRFIKDAGYRHAESGILVELHHRLNDNPALIPCDFTKLWRAREEIEIAGTVIAGLPRRSLALYLCLHGAGHCWEELRWLVDLTAALREPGAVDTAVAAAAAAGLDAPMLQALTLAHDWLALPVDARHLTRARADWRVEVLNHILARFYAPAAWYRTPRRGSFAALLRYALWLRLYTYSLKADWRYWRYQILRELITPADWNLVRLPDSLFWLFLLIRPIGWLLRRLPSRHGAMGHRTVRRKFRAYRRDRGAACSQPMTTDC